MANTNVSVIDPDKIRQASKQNRATTPKAAFGDVLDGISAMGPAAAELTAQATGGNDLAGSVLNAAFSAMDASGMGARAAMGSPYAQSPGMMGSPRYGTQFGGTSDPNSAVPGLNGANSGVTDPAQYQYEIMQTMNSNNLKLLELQALMQSNMQAWTTKSNILSADHRARMSMIEKFSARG